MQMDRLNNYPFVMFHGFAGFGENYTIFYEILKRISNLPSIDL